MRDVHFEKLAKRAIATFTHERAAILSGDVDALSAANAEKSALMGDLEAIEAQIRTAPQCNATMQNREEFANLLSIVARRTAENEQLAKANNSSSGDMWAGT